MRTDLFSSAGVRRRALSGPSARSLLFTLFGEYVLPRGGGVWTGTVVDALAQLEVEEKTARQALARTVTDGWLERERVGRRVRWGFTPSGLELFEQGAARIYSFTAALDQWDGTWLLLFTTVPEARRELRHRLRTRLAWAGFGSVAPGVWISPDPSRESEARRVLADLGLGADASSFTARYGTIGEQRALVKRAWDVGALAQRYEAFVDEFETMKRGGDAEAFVAETWLVHEWRRFPFVDPRLPMELLPRDWAGHRAQAVFAECHERWRRPAQRWFDDAFKAHDS